MYPRKPKELADDLESFVYIPVYCLFRYHKHNLSSNLADMLKGAPRIKQVAENRMNMSIAKAKSNFFYAEVPHTNGLYSGGETKYAKIQQGRPPILLSDDTSPAAKLLTELFLMLQRHYQTVKFRDLQQYLADPTSPPKSLPQQIEDSDEIEGWESPKTAFDIIGMQEPDSTGCRDILSPSSSSANSLSVRPLENHTMIMEIFNSVWKDKRGRVRNIMPYRGDKLYDQFDGNLVFKTDEINNPSNSSGASDPNKSESSRSKRKSDASEPDPNPRPKRKAKRAPVKKTVAHGIQIELRSTLSDDGNGDGDGDGGGNAVLV